MTSSNVIHEPADARFVMNLPDGEQAIIKYKLNAAAHTVDFFSTFVPASQRGNGLAEQLVTAAFAWADENDLAIAASCWYADRLLKQRSSGSHA